MASSELTTVVKKINDAKFPEDVFGLVTGKPAEQITKIITKIYQRLAKVVHPDKYIESADKQLAEEGFIKLTEWQTLALEKVKAGTYGIKTTPKPKSTWVVINIGKRAFEVDLTNPIATGDVCNLYPCKSGFLNLQNGVFKVPRDSQDNDLLENESTVLKKFYKGPKKMQPYLPELVETFRYEEESDREVRAVNVFKELKGFYTLREIREHYENGIDPKDMAWLFRRLLVILGFSHAENVIHSAVLPDHIMILPKDHGLVLIDWGYSVSNEPVKAISVEYEGWYPKEVLGKEVPDASADIYMAAKSMIYLLGGDPITNKMPISVPQKIRSFIEGCVLVTPSMRPSSAWELLHEFDNLIEQLWGPKTFHLFSMPAKKE